MLTIHWLYIKVNKFKSYTTLLIRILWCLAALKVVYKLYLCLIGKSVCIWVWEGMICSTYPREYINMSCNISEANIKRHVKSRHIPLFKVHDHGEGQYSYYIWTSSDQHLMMMNIDKYTKGLSLKKYSSITSFNSVLKVSLVLRC